VLTLRFYSLRALDPCESAPRRRPGARATADRLAARRHARARPQTKALNLARWGCPIRQRRDDNVGPLLL